MADSITDVKQDVETAVNEGQPVGNEEVNGVETSESKGLTDLLLSDAPQDDGTYESHALNWDQTESTAKIIRGIEGIAGNLNKAVVLIITGVIQKYQEMQEEETDEPQDDLGDELEQ